MSHDCVYDRDVVETAKSLCLHLQHGRCAFHQIHDEHVVERHILIRDELDGFLSDQAPYECGCCR